MHRGLALVFLCLAGCQCSPSRATPARPELDATPASLDFGTTSPGSTVTRTVTLRNTGDGVLTITALVLAGEAPEVFSLGAQTLTSLEVGGSAELHIVYAPLSAGVHAARLEVQSDAANTREFVITMGGTARVADGCANVTCDQPPGPCFAARGTCADGVCTYAPRAGASCDDGNACTTSDVCDATGVCGGTALSCTQPPAPTCLDAGHQRSFDPMGTCSAGACTWTAHDVACPLGCDAVTGACRSSCSSGLHACDAQCVSNLSVATCGASCVACAVPTNGMATCDGTSCGFTCATGFHTCANDCAANTAASSCGASCTPCVAPANATATCDGTSCGFACATGFHACGSACSANTSVASCGASCTPCGAPANATATCDGTSCGFACATGFHACGSACASNGSITSCGASCTPCVPPANATSSCDGTSCGFTCNAGFIACGAGCCAGAKGVSVGGQTCAVTSAGGVKCWGAGSLTPVDVPGLSGVAEVATNSYGVVPFTCVLTTQGGVKCWGRNNNGQLGDGTFSDHATPGDVSGLTSGVVALSVGFAHACAVTSGGAARCWGMNLYGQLGDGSTATSAVPVDVTGLSSGVVAIAAGEGSSCAVTSAGAVKCWGGNTSGQLGDASTTDRHTPVSVSGISTATRVAVSGSHACAIVSGFVRCWGAGFFGQLGNGSTNNSIIPVVTSGLSNVTALAVGAQTSCAVAAGALRCWGRNQAGQLGDGTTTDQAYPTPVLTLSSDVTSVSVGGTGCATLLSGHLKCWGYNANGQVGDGTTTGTSTPVSVVGF